MDIAKLFLHLSNTVNTKRLPPSVSQGIMREFYMETLQAKGFCNLDHYTDRDLDSLWHDTFWDEAQKRFTIPYDPSPSPYIVIPSYAQIFRGLGYFRASIYRGTRMGLETLTSDGKILEDSARVFPGAHQAIRFIGQADELVSEYLNRLAQQDDTVILEFALSSQQLVEFHSLYKVLPPGDRGAPGTNRELRESILRL